MRAGEMQDSNAGEWMVSARLSGLLDVGISPLARAAREGGLCRGWRIERRTVSKGERHRYPRNTKYLYRAVTPESDGSVYVLCDIVGDRLIPETYGTRAECERRAASDAYNEGPPTKIIQMNKPPELGVRLQRSQQ